MDGGYQSRRASLGLEGRPLHSHELTRDAEIHPNTMPAAALKTGKSTLRSPGGILPGGATELYSKGNIDEALYATNRSWSTMQVDKQEERAAKKKQQATCNKERIAERDRRDHLHFRKEVAVKGIGNKGSMRRASLPNILKGLGEWEPKEREASSNFLAERYARQKTEEQVADVPWHKVNAGYSEDGARLSSSMLAIKRRNSIAAIPMQAFKVVDRTSPWALPDPKRDTGFGGRSGRASFHS